MDFVCTYDNAAGVSPEVMQALNVTFPDAYCSAEDTVKIAEAVREKEGAAFCELPFDHVLEAESMGALVKYSDGMTGPRTEDYLTSDMKELLKLPEIDFTAGRMNTVLNACGELRRRGNQVVLDICGPFTILNFLIDTTCVFKTLRKDPELFARLSGRIGVQLLRYIKEAEQQGVQMISYADSVGSVKILGPKLAAQVVEDFTFGFVKQMLAQKNTDTLILLCPKTTFALLGTNKAKLVDYPLPGPMTYGEGCIASIGKLDIAGQQCIKNIHYPLKDGIIKRVVLES